MQKIANITLGRKQAVIAAAAVAGAIALFAGLDALSSRGYLGSRATKKAFGTAPAEVRMLNLRDETVNVRGVRLDAKAAKPEEGALDTPSGERRSFANLRSGRYRLTFSTPEGGALGECTLKLRNNEAYDFIAVEHGLAVVRNGAKADDVAELDVLTSTLCKG